MNQHTPHEERVKRFWAKTQPQGNGCIYWMGSRGGGRNNYGLTSYNGKGITTHRLSWILTHGPIPDGGWILHKCDNPPCVNPEHLYIGDNKQNVRDRIERHGPPDASRLPIRRGTQAWANKLSEDQVREIRKRWAPGMSKIFAKEYGVDPSNILLIIRGDTWGWLK